MANPEPIALQAPAQPDLQAGPRIVFDFELTLGISSRDLRFEWWPGACSPELALALYVEQLTALNAGGIHFDIDAMAPSIAEVMRRGLMTWALKEARRRATIERDGPELPPLPRLAPAMES